MTWTSANAGPQAVLGSRRFRALSRDLDLTVFEHAPEPPTHDRLT